MRRVDLLVILLLIVLAFELTGCDEDEVRLGESSKNSMSNYIIKEKMDETDRTALNAVLKRLFSGKDTAIVWQGPVTNNEYTVNLQEIIQPNCQKVFLAAASPKEGNPKKRGRPITTEAIFCIDEEDVWKLQ